MRITTVISSLQAGGAERVLSLLAGEFTDAGDEVTILTFEPDGAAPFYPLTDGVTLRRLDLFASSAGLLSAVTGNLQRISRLRAAILAESPDVVLSFMDQTNILTLLAVGKRLPVVAAERTHPATHPLGTVWRMMRRFVYPRAAILAVQAKSYTAHFPWMPASKMAVIPNPVPRPVHKHKPGQNKERYRAISAGRMDVHKDFATLIEAFALLSSEHPDWDLVIFGEGFERSNLETQIKTLGLESRVSLPGLTTELSREFAKSDLFASSSRYEGFPNVLCEAMACGLPAITTDCAEAIGDIVQNGRNGLVVPKRHSEALAKAMDDLMSDPERRAGMGTEAAAVADTFSEPEITARWRECLAEAAAGFYKGQEE